MIQNEKNKIDLYKKYQELDIFLIVKDQLNKGGFFIYIYIKEGFLYQRILKIYVLEFELNVF